MLLTSYYRTRNYLRDESGNLLTDNVANQNLLLDWITAVSPRIEQYVRRGIELTSRTEYFDVDYKQMIYFPYSYPISSISSIKTDSTGLFNGDESTLDSDDEYFIGTDSGSIDLVYTQNFVRNRGMQVVYTAGLAEDPTKSYFAGDGSSLSAGNYVKGGSSLAMGKVVSGDASEICIDNYWGIFQAGDTLTEYTDEELTTASGSTGNITSVTTASLAESYPAITRAAEVEIRYLWKHKHDLENVTSTPDGQSQRRNDASYDLQPETRSYLEPYRRMSPYV